MIKAKRVEYIKRVRRGKQGSKGQGEDSKAHPREEPVTSNRRGHNGRGHGTTPGRREAREWDSRRVGDEERRTGRQAEFNIGR